ncbi:MAG TPA: polyketide synthase dehydratase domain-containing protein, partial [Kineosporiaceae bacterium]
MTGLECRLTLTDGDFIMRNHRVHGVSVLPGVTFLDIVYRALAASGRDHARAVVRDIRFAEAVVTSEGFDREIRVVMPDDVDGVQPLVVDSRWTRDGEPCSGWHRNLTAELVYRDPEPHSPLDLAGRAARAAVRGDLAELYARARREEIVHGAAMRCTGRVLRGGPDDPFLLAELRLEHPGAGHEQRFHLHPAKMDASTLAGFAQTAVSGDHPFIPLSIREFRAVAPLVGTCWVYAQRPEVLSASGEVLTSDYTLHDDDGRLLARFTGISCKRIRFPGLITRLLAEVAPEHAAPPVAVAAPVAAAPVTAAPVTAAPVAAAPVAAPVPTGTVTGDALVAHLRGVVGAMLGRGAAQVPSGTGFYDLGLDSLAILQIGRDLEVLTGSALYPTLLFEYSTIDRLARHLATTYPHLSIPQPADQPTGQAAEPGGRAADDPGPPAAAPGDGER